MEGLQHVQTLRFFREDEPFRVIEAMSYLKEKNLLPPLWLELERWVCEKWYESEANKGWAWQTGAEMTDLFDDWKFNKNSLRGMINKCEMEDELKSARKEMCHILSSYPPASKEMLEALSQVFDQIKNEIVFVV